MKRTNATAPDDIATVAETGAADNGESNSEPAPSAARAAGGLADRIKALQSNASPRVADLKARVRAGIDRVRTDTHDIGGGLRRRRKTAVIEDMSGRADTRLAPPGVNDYELPRISGSASSAADGSDGVGAKDAASVEPATDARVGTDAAAQAVTPADGERSTPTAISEANRGESGNLAAAAATAAAKTVSTFRASIDTALQQTRTIGRVGLTAVHARLKRRRPEAAASPAAIEARQRAPKNIHRIDTPLAAPGAEAPAADDAPVGAVWRDGREIAATGSSDDFVRTSRTQMARRKGGRQRLTTFVSTLLVAAVAGGIVHIATTFAIPALRIGSAFDRLKRNLPENNFLIMAGEAGRPLPANMELPFLSPDMRYAFCRYDLTQGPVSVTATLPEAGWSLALYTPQGDNFYAVPGQDGRVTDAAFTIVPASDRLINLTPGVRKADVDATQVTSPQREGLVVIRAPLKGVAYQHGINKALLAATCRPRATTQR